MRKVLLMVVLMLTATAVARAQRGSVWKHFTRPDVGAGVLFYSLATHDSVASNNVDSRADLLVVSAFGGLNFPVVEFNEDLTLGFNPNAEVGGTMSTESPVATLEAPLYMTLKYGTDATWAGSPNIFGASLGFGYRLTAFVFPAQVITFGMPNFMAEINVGKRRSAIGLIKLRYSLSLGNHDETFVFDDGGPDEHLIFTHHAFHLLFTPGY